jgi:hypothetical protein
MIQKFYHLIMLLVCLAGLEKACARNVTLNWDASNSSNITGYHVYYGTTSGIYSYKVNAGNTTAVTITNLAPGVTYYFVATSQDANGNQSPYSGEVSLTIPSILTMTPAASPGKAASIQFSVATGHWYEVQATTDLQNWSSIWQSAVVASNALMQFSDPNASSFTSRFYRLVSH